jgi:hypothetical protein
MFNMNPTENVKNISIVACWWRNSEGSAQVTFVIGTDQFTE